MWWVEPQQKIHFDVIEGDVWHCTPKMLERKYLQSYRMTFLTFEYLLPELSPFIYPSATQFVRTPIPFKKAMKTVLY
jgi:hypothetical protein